MKKANARQSRTGKLIDYLLAHGVSSLDKANSKLYTGNFSPGCLTCIKGTWACVSLNYPCTRRCFFCPQDRNETKDYQPFCDGVEFHSVSDFVAFLKKFEFEGVGITGGEPFMAFDLLLNYVKAISSEFDDKMYIWVYTNGDLVTRDKLRRLKDAGLNEIRFNLAARNYDLKPVILAKKIIKHVTVETPAIPEERSILHSALKTLADKKINRLNLHELHADTFNWNSLKERKYCFKKNTGMADSEISAMETFGYCLDNKLETSFNFCTTEYKNSYQSLGMRKRYSGLVLFPYESLTDLYYIRAISVQISGDHALSLINLPVFLNKFKMWEHHKNRNRLTIHPDLFMKIPETILNRLDLKVTYYAPLMANHNANIKSTGKKIKLNDSFEISCGRVKHQYIAVSSDYTVPFIQLFLKKQSRQKATAKLLKMSGNRKVKAANNLNGPIKKLSKFYSLFKDIEYSDVQPGQKITYE